MKTRRILALTGKEFKKLIREPSILFLTLIFPMVLTLAFGAAFGSLGTGGGDSVYTVAVVDLDESSIEHWASDFREAINRMEVLVVEEYGDNSSAYNDLQQGIVSAVLVLPEDFGDSLQSFILNPSDPKQWINSTIYQAVDQGSMIFGAVVPPFIQQALGETLSGGQVSMLLPVEIGVPQQVATSQLTQFDYMVPGIYSFAAIFITMTVAQGFSSEREQGLLRRLNMTPTTSTDLILSQILYNLISGSIQVAIVYIVSGFMGFQTQADIAGIAIALVIVLLLTLCNVGFGLITASVVKNSGSATGLSFLFILPQMFLGTFVPASKEFARFVPSYYVTDALTSLLLRGAPATSQTVIMDLMVLSLVSLIVVVTGIVVYQRFGRD